MLEQLEQHFGAERGGDQQAPSLEVVAAHGLGTPVIMQRAAAGVAWQVGELASGLTDQTGART